MIPLLIIPIDGKPWAVAVDRPTQLGRDDDCTVPIASHAVSRYHAQLTWDGTRAWVEDLGSRNGTFVNGQRVEAPTALNDRDELCLGNVALQFRLTTHAPRTIDARHGAGRERGMIVFHCPHCAHRIGAEPTMAHFVRACPACQHHLVISPPPPPAIAEAPAAHLAPVSCAAAASAAESGWTVSMEPARIEAPEPAPDQVRAAAAPPPGHTEAAPRWLRVPAAMIAVEARPEPIAAAAAPGAAVDVLERASCAPAGEAAQVQSTPNVASEPTRVRHVPARWDVSDQHTATIRSPDPAPRLQPLELVRRVPWDGAPAPAEAPPPMSAARPAAPQDDAVPLPWSQALERPGIRMDHHPSAAPLRAETQPPAVNTATEAPRIDERDWFADPINQPWQPTKEGGKGRSAKRKE